MPPERRLAAILHADVVGHSQPYTHTAPRAIDMTNHDDRVAQMLDDT